MKYLIFGLGNIGSEYANTRHNIGFIIADAMAQQADVQFEPARYASKAVVKHRGRQFILLKPSTYMNLSGKAVKYWMEKEKVALDRILIVTDDIAIPLGTLRMKKKGGDGGHNGLFSIIELLGTESFGRLRIGIGDDYSRGYQVDFVLGKWTKEEEKVMITKVKTAVDMIKSFGILGVDRTMNAYNNK